jgi:ureidoglycolate lyase
VITLKPIAVDENNFSLFGLFYDLDPDGTEGKVIRDAGDGYRDSHTAKPLIDKLGSLGMTSVPSVPYSIGRMESHQHSQEALFCAGEPIAFLVAPSDGEKLSADAVRAFFILPGQVVVLHRGTWHSPALGILGPTSYYWMAETYDGEPTVWKNIENGPVQLVGSLAGE